MIITRIVLLGLFGCVGAICGMEESPAELSWIIVNPIVQKVFLPQNKAISCIISSDGNAYCLNVNDDCKRSDQTIKNLLCIVKKQLNAIKPTDKDIFKVSYTDISLSQKMDDKPFKKHNLFIQYTTSGQSAWFNDTTIKSNYSFQVFKNISDNKKLDIFCFVYNENDERVNTVQVHDSSYDLLALNMLKDSLMYYISSDQKNIAEIAKCWIGCDKPSINNSSEFNTVTCGYDVGYEKCKLCIKAEDYCYVTGGKYCRIQQLNHEKLQEICQNGKQFILKVKNLTDGTMIKMNIIKVKDRSKSYELQASAIPSEVFNATLVNKDHPQKYTTWQRVQCFLNYYSEPLAMVGFFSFISICFIRMVLL